MFSATTLHMAYYIEQERLGRRRLAERTGLSEMKVRLALEAMRERGWVILERSGVSLTQLGKRAFAPILGAVVDVADVKLQGLSMGPSHRTGQVRGIQVPEAWRLRDEAIRAGASGLIVLARRHGAWTFSHNGEAIALRNPEDAETLDHAFPAAAEGDCLFIVSGAQRVVCSQGFWNCIRTILVKSS